MELAPIVLFTFKRLDTLKKTVESLQQNYLAAESDLYIFSDAAKGESDKQAVSAVRKYINSIDGFKSITIHEGISNKGLATSIIDGVSEVLKVHQNVIVLEDDLVTTSNFLNFMNESLERFADHKKVFSVSGFSFNLNMDKKYPYDIYFLNRGWSWGWATWKDRWEQVDWQIEDYELFVKNKKARKAFSQGGSDLNTMLEKQMTGKLDSWAIRWFYNQYKFNGLTVYPIKSKIINEGFGADATHTKGSSRRYIPILDNEKNVGINYPPAIGLTISAQKKFQYKMSLFSRLRSKIETFLGL
ncbi:sugar transferase [Flavobacterium sp. KACC 22763]|uniref:sugar transferase n=1 Tax=Flavobacterium sp. KACC 22763 TaxID=3025668 RepID=UPI0023673B3E|nr:sugar transferase [Flavobacterium sp. KACC 22763]WDF62502.1 sugar transferase [Flavobacterium sp. KACC 22763]